MLEIGNKVGELVYIVRHVDTLLFILSVSLIHTFVRSDIYECSNTTARVIFFLETLGWCLHG